jgi:thiol:disulfide interchange protein
MIDTREARLAHAKKRLAMVLAGAFAGIAVGIAGVYGIGRLTGNAAVPPECRPAQEIARRIAPMIRGEVAALTPAKAPKPMPELAFQDESSARKTLADWRGRTVLLNLWAAWCVLAVNIDTRDTAKPKAWLKEVGINRLGYFADPSAKVFQDLKEAGKAFGMPTTILIDANGCEIATLSGPAEWASEDALKVISAALVKS